MGWLAFLIAAVVYCSTIEPTASFWDCPEFITTGYRLEVGHPPGAPFFALTANLFSQFVSDPSQVARMVNTMSALLSATCIMFLFWTISHLARKLIVRDGETIELGKLIAIEGSALVGALVYTATPSGSRPSKARSMPIHRHSRQWCSGSSSNGRTMPTSHTLTAGSCSSPT